MKPEKLARRLNEPYGSGLDGHRIEGCQQIETDGALGAPCKLTNGVGLVWARIGQDLPASEDPCTAAWVLGESEGRAAGSSPQATHALPPGQGKEVLICLPTPPSAD